MHYETVFIVNPVLSEEQADQTAKKYEDFLKSKDSGGPIVFFTFLKIKVLPINFSNNPVFSIT